MASRFVFGFLGEVKMNNKIQDQIPKVIMIQIVMWIIMLVWVSVSKADTPLQNMIKYDQASFTLSRGCSGTLICPRTGLTAAHCRTTGQRVTANLSNGSKVTGRVIAHLHRGGVDAAIIRFNTTVSNIEPVPFASTFPPDGAEVLVYGQAGAAGSKRITRFRANVDLRGDGGFLDLKGDTAAIGGESGGGTFYNGKTIGVVSRTESGRSYRSGRGSWTGVSVTDKTYDLVVKHLCKVDT